MMKIRAEATVATAAAASAISMVISPFVVFVSRCSQSDDEDESGSDGGDCGSSKRDQHSGFSFHFLSGFSCPRRHAYNTILSGRFVRIVKIDRLFVKNEEAPDLHRNHYVRCAFSCTA